MEAFWGIHFLVKSALYSASTTVSNFNTFRVGKFDGTVLTLVLLSLSLA